LQKCAAKVRLFPETAKLSADYFVLEDVIVLTLMSCW